MPDEREKDRTPSTEERATGAPLSTAEAYLALRFIVDMGLEEGTLPEPEQLANPSRLPATEGKRTRRITTQTPLESTLESRSEPAPHLQTSTSYSKAKISGSPDSPPESAATARPRKIDLSPITSLEELREAMANISDLPVKDTAVNLVFGEGKQQSPPVMLIGEAPGEDEDRTGRPFVGRAGKLLEKMLQAIGLNREEVYITNILNWRPPGNRPPKPDEIATCLPFLIRHIELVQPQTLLLLGGPSAQAVLKTEGSVTRMRGKWWDFSTSDSSSPTPALVTYHPAYLLRSPHQKRESWKDLRLLKKKIGNS